MIKINKLNDFYYLHMISYPQQRSRNMITITYFCASRHVDFFLTPQTHSHNISSFMSLTIILNNHWLHVLLVIFPTTPFLSQSPFLLYGDSLLFSPYHHNPSLVTCKHTIQYVAMSPFSLCSFSFSLSTGRAGQWHWMLPLTQSDPQKDSAADWRQLGPCL